MKKIVTIAIAVLAAAAVIGKGVEQVSVVENEITTISVPFGIQSYTPSNKEVVRIEKISDTTLRVTARRRGRCDLEVRGDRQLVQKYEITVQGDLVAVLETLTKELDSVQEVKAQIVGESIRVEGEISSIRKWEYLTKVLSSYGAVRNFATFYPGPEVLLKMKETLMQAGFEVVFEHFGQDSRKWKPNVVALAINKQTRIMTVQARVYTPEQKDRIMRCLATEKWLALVSDTNKSDAGKAAGEFHIRALVDVDVDMPTIRLGVVYFALGEKEARNLGSHGVPEVQGVFSHLQNLVRGGTGQSTATIGANLDTTIRFMANNGISRMSQKGFTLLKSWDGEGATFKSGGTLNVRVAGTNNGDLKEVPYGFEVKVKGGMVDAVAADLDLDISISGVEVLGNGDIDQKQDQSKQKILCAIGKTTVIGGFGKMVETQTLDGLPILRNTPLLSWFVSESDRSENDSRLLIMVSPELHDGSRDGMMNADAEITLPVLTDSSKTIDERKDERKPFSGFWSWLNWFTF